MALDAKADDLDSLALTSMMQYSSLLGFKAYWMLHSPTMPRLRMTLMEVARSLKYSLLDERPDGVSCVNSERIKVLHVADSDAVVSAISDDFILDLLPAPEVLVDQDLVRDREGLLVFVVSEARAETSEGICRSHQDGESDLLGNNNSLLHTLRRVGQSESLVDGQELLREDLSVPTISIPVNDFLSLILIMIIITIIIIIITITKNNNNNNNNYNNNR